ncbi:MAG TPA: hypothetical protein VGS21_00760 [Acidimicrobiales bacterium]|nr:hypothetical protein [Acidimicrobiales bacterium]
MTGVATIPPAGIGPQAGAGRGKVDLFMRRLLRVPDVAPKKARRQAERLFSTSMALSGLRCLLSYVIFPFVLPAIGVATSVAPLIGVPVGVVALVFDAIGMRRFFVADHRYRFGMAALYLAVMGLVSYLVVIDLIHAAR